MWQIHSDSDQTAWNSEFLQSKLQRISLMRSQNWSVMSCVHFSTFTRTLALFLESEAEKLEQHILNAQSKMLCVCEPLQCKVIRIRMICALLNGCHNYTSAMHNVIYFFTQNWFCFLWRIECAMCNWIVRWSIGVNAVNYNSSSSGSSCCCSETLARLSLDSP